MSRVLLLTDDRLGARMAGPAIRSVELARQLAPIHEVTVASTQPHEEGLDLPFRVRFGARGPELTSLAAQHDVMVAGGFVYAQHPALMRLATYRVLDLYDPMLLEDLACLAGELGAFQLAEHRRWLDAQMAAADFMICASERQRDYWLGRLCALGRLDHTLYSQDPTVRRLLDVVPFGLPAMSPTSGMPLLRALPGIGPDEVVLLWGGGLWDWLDPLTPIRAAASLQDAFPRLKLVFMAGRSPNPTTPEMPMQARARQLAAELGALGRSVHFLEEWIPYEQRGSLLKEADAAFSAHYDHLETRFAFRTRILDYLWAGLPILATRGDAMADLIEAEGLGSTLAAGDVEGWSRALRRMEHETSWREACAERVRRVAPRFHWERAIAPLRAFCEAPYATPRGAPPIVLGGAGSLLVKGWLSLRQEGLEGLSGRVRRYVARQRGGPA